MLNKTFIIIKHIKILYYNIKKIPVYHLLRSPNHVHLRRSTYTVVGVTVDHPSHHHLVVVDTKSTILKSYNVILSIKPWPQGFFSNASIIIRWRSKLSSEPTFLVLDISTFRLVCFFQISISKRWTQIRTSFFFFGIYHCGLS